MMFPTVCSVIDQDRVGGERERGIEGKASKKK